MLNKTVVLKDLRVVKVKDVLKRDLGLNHFEFIFISDCGVQFKEDDVIDMQMEMEFPEESTDNYIN